MGTLKRVIRRQVDASPNQLLSVADPTRPSGLAGYRITNANTSDVYVKFYDNSSGSVTVGATEPDYGSILVPASAQLHERFDSGSNPLWSFGTAITAAATTTDTGNTSPTSDVTIELFYWE